MVRSESTTLDVVALTADDIAAGLALSDAAGWNQTADDWAGFIAIGRTIGLRDAAGTLIATAATLRYGAQGWISMVLVAASERHRGLASVLMDRCVADLRSDGTQPMLDATPAGAAVYRQLGFVCGAGFERWESTGPIGDAADRDTATSATDTIVGHARPGQRDAIARLDRAATGLDRGFLFDAFLARPGTQSWLANDGQGFVLARDGRRARQVGPLVATDDAQAIALLRAALASVPADERVFIDVPSERRAVTQWLERRGFRPQRPFVRMALGPHAPPVLDARCGALVGPEFG